MTDGSEQVEERAGNAADEVFQDVMAVIDDYGSRREAVEDALSEMERRWIRTEGGEGSIQDGEERNNRSADTDTDQGDADAE